MPSSPRWRSSRGSSLDNQAERAEAKKWFEEAVKGDPKRMDAWFQLAGACADLGEGEEAAIARATATNLVETSACPMLRAAWGCVNLRVRDGAQRCLARALSALGRKGEALQQLDSASAYAELPALRVAGPNRGEVEAREAARMKLFDLEKQIAELRRQLGGR